MLTDGEYLNDIALKYLIRTCDLFGDSDDDYEDSEEEEEGSISEESDESDGMVTDDDSFIVNGMELDFEDAEEYDF
jgi:hypothetical protein